MQSKSRFRLTEATLDFGDGNETPVQLVASDNDASHITLLMGANGTCKSRLLSSCVDLFYRVEESLGLENDSRRGLRRSDPDASARHCLNATIERDGNKFEIGYNRISNTVACLPSRTLAIANLVRDRFPFVDRAIDDASRYYYLGVRQSSNLTTTGAMDRIAAEAFLGIVHEKAKTATFSNWVRQLFPRSQLGIGFEDYSKDRVRKFLSAPEDWINERYKPLEKPPEFSRRANERFAEAMNEIPSIIKLLDFLEYTAWKHESSLGLSSKRTSLTILQPEMMSIDDLATFGELRRALYLAMALRLIGRPSLKIKTGSWMDFSSLSSGEQNLVATGARLVGYASPGSFIVIDEPEVSLNVAWQQRYIQLIQDTLVHAPGSHVLIASHSPYLVSDLKAENATIVVVERRGKDLSFKSQPSKFWGWGSEAILYEVLGLPSASNYLFSRELTSVLKLVESDSKDVEPFKRFLDKSAQLDLPADAEPLRMVIEEIRQHYQSLNS
jgi:predicted ATPase